MCFHNCRNGYDAMEYVSTWGCVVVINRFSCALHVWLVAVRWYGTGHCTPRTAVGQNSTSRDANIKRGKGGRLRPTAGCGCAGVIRKDKHKQARGQLSAACDAFALPPVLLSVHRVLCVLVLVRAARGPRATAAGPCARADTDTGADTRRAARHGGRVVRDAYHHGVPALSARGHGERDRDR